MTEVTSPLLTKEYLREQLALMEARLRGEHFDLRADIRRAFFIQTIVIVGSLTAIFAALTKL